MMLSEGKEVTEIDAQCNMVKHRIKNPGTNIRRQLKHNMVRNKTHQLQELGAEWDQWAVVPYFIRKKRKPEEKKSGLKQLWQNVNILKSEWWAFLYNILF